MGLSILLTTACATKSDLRELELELMDSMRRQEQMIEALQRLTQATQDSVAVNAESLFNLQGNTNRQLLDIQDQLVTLGELAGQSQRNVAAMRDLIERQRQSSVAMPPGNDLPPGEGDESDEAEGIFNAGVTNYNRGSLGASTRAFESFLQTHPSHDRAPEAQYYLGDILVQENDLEGAIDAFSRIGELYPASDVVPQSIYRIGLLHADMGNTDEAISAYERVVNTYPDSDVAGLAQEKLDELR
jgi:tol-pal system protein YbgF